MHLISFQHMCDVYTVHGTKNGSEMFHFLCHPVPKSKTETTDARRYIHDETLHDFHTT